MASKGLVRLVILLVTHGWFCLGGGVHLSESEVHVSGFKGLSQDTYPVGSFGTQESMMNEQTIAAAPTTGHHRHRHHRHRKTGAPKHPSPGLVAPALPPYHAHAHVPVPAPVSGGRPAHSPFPFIPLPAPSTDCHQKCSEPYTLTPAGDLCGCVLPMLTSLQLGVAPYVFFPLVSELAQELAAGTNLSQSQVRILGANTVENNMDETEVKVELVPMGGFFENATANLIAARLWKHQVGISESLFGTYTVLSVSYPGLPPSPLSPGGVAHGPVSGPYEEPLSVNVKKKGIKPGVGIIAVVVLTASLSVICLVAVWLAWHCKNSKSHMEVDRILSAPSANKKSGPSMLSSSLASSTTISFASSFTPYAGSAKTFTYAEIERATNNFKLQNIIGEGGFGRVYDGVLDDNTRVAVKVLTRDDHQGSREFVAEVEMLSRLHHRNLVKLLGICIEEHFRCLVFELISNGSVESHLHGIDKETSPLDWEARLKIALGAARGLAYLHEDSNPRVIHRDFKASNILLEADFTPKVSDFGLAKAATDEVNNHLSTRVMGTFGYVAPEYAMTGHLLVKSDVYSYGVVLLELLSGRKPVDMTQPPGQENLVTWARPLLNHKAGLEILVDPSLTNVSFDSLEKVAAIASMCVQPEVSHRPLMGEVVQALKLVYNDSDASDGLVSGNGSLHGETRREKVPRQASVRPIHGHESDSFISIDYDSGEAGRQVGVGGKMLSASESFVGEIEARHQCASAPPITSKKPKRTWYKVRNRDNGTVSESALLRYKPDETNRNCYSGDTWLL